MVAVDSNLQRTQGSNKRCMWIHSCPAHCSWLSSTSQPTSANSDGSLLDVIVTIRLCSVTALFTTSACSTVGLVAGWLACWTQVQKGLGSNRSHDSFRETVHTHHASVHQGAELVAALLSKGCEGNCGPGGK